jgi:alkanesulfonate monooxygenase SsuD/methylene tetrahydromethanopterin reductase-like flavin-dependent oxidoreductase (luciferase family)
VVAAAVEGGIDTIWLGRRLLEVDAFPMWSGGLEPFVELAYLAGRHPGIRVALGAAVLPLRDVQWRRQAGGHPGPAHRRARSC